MNFLALYRGRTLAEAQVVALSSDQAVVSEFAKRLLAQDHEETDSTLESLRQGKLRALEAIREEASDDN